MTPCPVRIRGVVFPSQKAAAEHFGVVPSAISNTLLRNGHCDNLGTFPARWNNTNAYARPVAIGPVSFRSQKAAAESLGVPRSLINRFANGTLRSAGIERLMAAAMAFANRKEM